MIKNLLPILGLLGRRTHTAVSGRLPLFFWQGPKTVVPLQSRGPHPFTVIERLRKMWRVDPVVPSFDSTSEWERAQDYRRQVVAFQSDLEVAQWGSSHNPARVQFELGMTHVYHGDLKKATRCFQVRLDNPSAANAKYWESKSERMLDAIEQQYYPSLMLEKYQGALDDLCEQHGGDRFYLAASLKDCGDAAAACGQYREAMAFYQRMIAAQKANPQAADGSWAQSCVGTLALLDGQSENAVACYQARLETLSGGSIQSALDLANLATAYRQAGDQPSAVSQLSLAHAICAAQLGSDHDLTRVLAHGLVPDPSAADYPDFYRHF